MMWKWHDMGMPSCCQDLEQLWPERHMDGHTQSCWEKWPQLDFSLPVNWAMKRSFWKLSLNCSLRCKYGKSAYLVKALHLLCPGYFYATVSLLSRFICKNVLYCYWYSSVVCCILLLKIWIRSLKHYLMKYDCPAILTNISVNENCNRNRIF